MVFHSIRKKIYRPTNEKFGLFEAIWWPHVDIWLRYITIVSEIHKLGKGQFTILDVGAGGNIITWFVNPLKHEIYTVDINKEAFSYSKESVNPIICDGCKLPFSSNSFDIVTSIDCLEHVNLESRKTYLQELKRVSKKKVVLHVPVNDNSMFRSKECDLKFAMKCKEILGFEEKNTAEHIRSGGWVSFSLLEEEFPAASLKPMQNCDVWLTYMLLSMRPDPRMFLTGLIYLIFLKKRDNEPPYYACTVVYDKDQRL